MRLSRIWRSNCLGFYLECYDSDRPARLNRLSSNSFLQIRIRPLGCT